MTDPRERRNRLIGVGFDPNPDGHDRITKGPDFTLRGGTKETHERMQEVAMRVSQDLKRQGTTMRGAEPQQVRDAIMRAEDECG